MIWTRIRKRFDIRCSLRSKQVRVLRTSVHQSLLFVLVTETSSVTKPSDSFSTLLIIIAFTTLVVILILVGVVYLYVQQKKTAGTKRRPYPSDGKATNKIQRLWERVLAWRSSKPDLQQPIPDVQSLEGLLEMSISTTEPGKTHALSRRQKGDKGVLFSVASIDSTNTRSRNRPGERDWHRPLWHSSSWQMA